tara:strand:+ start:5505 stop:6266 length:762 start_codon:yes stop_codon:yes gene_type:complete
LKISIITPTFNSQETIKDNINSIIQQDYENWEQIIIDNISKDKTLNIVSQFNNNKITFISEKDKGIFDAINKGILKASGDIISILHSDDFFYDNTSLSNIINCFINNQTDIVYGDLIYVQKSNKEKILRYWKSNQYKKGIFFKGWSPPHPSFFVKKKVYEQHGNYNISLGNSSDFDLMYRFLEINKIHSIYIDKIIVSMRYGGKSNKNIKTILSQNLIIFNILKINKNIFKIISFIFFKLINRFKQFLKIPKI